MFNDRCEAIRGYDGIVYFIDDARVTREEFHKYRAQHELTDFVDTEFSLPVTYNKITVGHWMSIVDQCTQEYLYALSGCEEYNFDEKSSFHCCRMNMRDKFMTIDQHNYLYNRGEEFGFYKSHCNRDPIESPAYRDCLGCHMSPEDIRTCLDIKERKRSDDAYNEMMMEELRRDGY